MDKNLTNVRVAHYIYLPSEDYEVVKDTWNTLVQKHGLTGLSPDEFISGDKALTNTIPATIQDEHVVLGLLIVKGITIIELMYLSNASSAPALLAEIESIRQGLHDQLSFAIGETTVIAHEGKNGPDPLDIPESLFAEPRIYKGEIKGASIEIVRLSEQLRHYYMVEKKNAGKAIDFLTSKLPAIDGRLFKLARQSVFFRDQHHFIKDKNRTCDQRLSDILNKWSNAKSSSEAKIDQLEDDVEMLSTMYGELIGSLRLVKNAHDIISKDLRALDKLLAEVIVNPKDLSDFRNAFTENQEVLLKELSIDDDLIHRSLDDTRATIEVVRTRIEIERSRESLFLQKEGVSVQTAAGFIELFIIGFYTLEAWELLASKEVFEHIVVPLKLGVDFMFATMMVALTHYAAKFIQKERSSLGLTLSALGVIISVVLMVMLTYYARGH